MSTSSARGAGQPEPPVKMDVSFPAEVGRIADIVDRVKALSQELHGESGAEKEQEIALALTEALANAVKHGCRNDRSQTVRCLVRADDSVMLITVSDSGPGFDPGSVANPLELAGLTADHGRGLFMIRQLMDEVSFARNGAEIRMKKNFRS